MAQFERDNPWEKDGRRGRKVCLAAVLVLCALFAPAQQAWAAKMQRPVRIGALTTSWGVTPSVLGLRDGLVEQGYREDHDFVIGTRFTSGDISALPKAAEDLMRQGVDIIFAVGVSETKSAQRATSTIPIVFTLVDDPVGAGLIGGYAHPGGNTTGVADGNIVLAPKRLAVFKEIIPRLKKVIFVYHAEDSGSAQQAKAYGSAGKRLGIEFLDRAVRTPDQARAIFRALGKGDVDGILSPVTVNLNVPGLVLETSARRGIPTMFPGKFLLEQGGLASYAPSYYSSGVQAARLVGKIMEGVKPADIPVEVNSDIEFIINLKVAKLLGLKIRPEVLYQADRLMR